MDDRRFDELARTMATDGTSRRRVVKGILGAAAAGAFGLFAEAETFAARQRKRKPKYYRCNEDSCDGTGGKECGRNGCYCYRHRGGYACVDGLVQNDDKRCRKDRQCPNEQVCVKSGPACGDGKGFCRPLCRKR